MSNEEFEKLVKEAKREDIRSTIKYLVIFFVFFFVLIFLMGNYPHPIFDLTYFVAMLLFFAALIAAASDIEIWKVFVGIVIAIILIALFSLFDNSDFGCGPYCDEVDPYDRVAPW